MNVRQVGWVSIVLIGLAAPLAAEPAHFWISASNVAPMGPEAPGIAGVNGDVPFLHVWAQPATVGQGAWNESTNPFKRIQNFSLNLVTSAPLVEFVDDSFVIHNPPLDATRRFEFVHDSSDDLMSSSTLPDKIQGLEAFSITPGGGFTGIGPTCLPNDSHCFATPSGVPAWLVASLAFRMIADTGSTEFRLQIGAHGINHAGENSMQTSVVFGFDPVGSEPVYNGLSNREATLASDEADLVVEAFPRLLGDYNRNGFVDAADYVVWRKTLDTNVTAGTGADGNNNGTIEIEDYNLWRAQFGGTRGQGANGSPLANPVPEPSTQTLLTALSCALLVGRRGNHGALNNLRHTRRSAPWT